MCMRSCTMAHVINYIAYMIIFVQHLTVELLFYSNEYVEVLCDINAFLDAHKLQVVSKSNSANDGPSIDINSS